MLLYNSKFQEYGAGRMLTGEVKKRLIEVITEVVERHRRARAAVTDEVIDCFFFNLLALLQKFRQGSD